MSMKSTRIEVAVRRQVLWIGGEAYPVHNIARAQTVVLTPLRGRAVARFLGLLVLWLVLGFGVLLVTGSDVPPELVFGVIGLLILVSLINLVRRLATPRFYALVIETSGSPRTALVTKDERQLQTVVDSVMNAIDNPKVAMAPILIDNFVGNQQINVSGGQVGNIGPGGRVGSLR